MGNANGSIREEVVKAVKENPDLTYAQIAKLLDVKPHQVAIWANRVGIFRRKPTNRPAEDEGLEERIRQLEHELAEARQLKAAREIRFERDGSKVAVHGLSEQPLIAEHKDWLRFLRKNGAAALREFIEEQFGTSNGSGSPRVQ
jgi:hypothetical protein